MKKLISLLLILCITISFVSAEFDYVIGPEYASAPASQAQNMYLDNRCLQTELGGQTFIAPYTGNITGFRIKIMSVITSSLLIRTYISPVDIDHHPIAPNTLLGSRPFTNFTTGWDTWVFDSHFPVVEGNEYAIWWGGNQDCVQLGTIFSYMTNTSIYNYDGGGELFRDTRNGLPWVGGSPSGRDWVMNLTYYGTEPVMEEQVETLSVQGDNTAGNAAYISMMQSAQRKLAQPKCEDIWCKIHQFILRLRERFGLQ